MQTGVEMRLRAVTGAVRAFDIRAKALRQEGTLDTEGMVVRAEGTLWHTSDLALKVTLNILVFTLRAT
jgi:hypothetical protein